MNENTIVEPAQSRVRRTSTAARSGLDVAEARDAVASITAQRRVHLAAACSRGMVTAGLLDHLAAAGDLDKVATLLVLAAWLRRVGYAPHTCGFVANAGCADRAVERVERRLDKLHRQHGRRVALIGHSRGGHYARALGHRHPDLVSHAISIGAGLRKMLAISYPTQLLAAGARRVVLRSGRARSPRCLTDACDCSFARDFAGPFPEDRVRLWSIYSKGDGVVRWQSAIVPYGTCVEVTSSHVGLVFNRKTYRVIANALAEPELQSHPSGGARC